MSDGGKPAPEMSVTKRALQTIDKLQRRVAALEGREAEPIAVIGMGCRYPGGADSPRAFWRLLCEGREAIRDVPAGRFDLAELHDPDPEKPGKMYMRSAGFLDQVDGFDAPFFRISPREAAQMDPQQRLFLEVSWEALENAGKTREMLSESPTAVFAGVLSNDYAHLPGTLAERIDAYYYPGVNSSFIAGRLSYFLGLHGPSVSLDTACSSSLVAVHLASQALRSGEATMAIAGGVNLLLSPETSMFLCKAGAMSPTGHCRAFDKDADGMVRGEGCGVVVLKRLSDALADGDTVLAVIRGSAVNHDGPSGGLTVPNAQAQEMVYRQALARSGVDPQRVCYVETHGTGTNLGDPVELQGLSAVYGGDRTNPLLIGSVKTNIGHTDSAAGVAGLIKGVLTLQNGEVAPSLHFKEPNPEFHWSGSGLAVVDVRAALPDSDEPRVLGVSSFGLSGMNAHLILEEHRGALAAPEPAADREYQLLTVTAQDSEALRDLAQRYTSRLTDPLLDPASLQAICAAAAKHRTHFAQRLGVVGSSAAEIAESLQTFRREGMASGVAVGETLAATEPRVAWVFSGQGGQWWAMGRELMGREPVFRETLNEIDTCFQRESGWSLLEEMLAPEEESRIHDTEVAQPAIFAVQVALANLWKSWGVPVHGIVGHSMGEVAAAHVAGALDLADAVRVIYHRARLMEGNTGLGKMAAVGLPMKEAEAVCADYVERVSVAVENSPRSVVISGEAEAMDEILAGLESRGVFCRELLVKFASHCPQVERYQDELALAVDSIEPSPPEVPLISTVTGLLVEGAAHVPEYWARNIVAPVRFATAIAELGQRDFDVFIEMDPHPILGNAMAETLEDSDRSAVVAGSLHREKSDEQAMMESAALLWAHGVPVDFGRLYPQKASPIDLPNYPWQRKRYWLAAGSRARGPLAALDSTGDVGGALVGTEIESPLAETQFHTELSLETTELLQGHDIHGHPICPSTYYLALAFDAASAIGRTATAVEDLELLEPLELEERAVEIRTVVSGSDEGAGHAGFQVFSRRPGSRSWILHARGRLTETSEPTDAGHEVRDLAAIEQRLNEVDRDEFYGRLDSAGYGYSGPFRSVDRLWRSEDEVLGEVVLPAEAALAAAASLFHPAQLDACMHSLLATSNTGDDGGLFIPIAVEKVELARPLESRVWVHGRMRPGSPETQELLTFDLEMLTPAGELVGRIVGLRLRAAGVGLGAVDGSGRMEDWLHEIQWRHKEIEDYSNGRSAAGTWVVFTDGQDLGRSLIGLLEASGHSPVVVSPGERFESLGANRWIIDPLSPGDFGLLTADLAEAGVVCTHVVYLWALDISPGDELTAAELEDGQLRLCGGLLHLVQALVGAALKEYPTLGIITRESQSVNSESDSLDGYQQGSAWGLGRVIEQEHPELRTICIDLDSVVGGDQSALLRREMESSDGERQIAFRQGSRYVARLARVRAPQSAPGLSSGVAPYRLMSSGYGILDNLHLARLVRRPPEAGEVEVEVQSAGLNFRDVLNALGMLGDMAAEMGIESAEQMPFGFECSGRISAVGEGVLGLRIGDPVIAAPVAGTLATHVTVDSELVVAKPAELDFSAAASLPVAFLTAYYALHHLAKIGPGDRVLIHSAAGGVGQAAVQLARRVGAEVFATASPGKWDSVRALGVEHVMSSRTLDFVRQIMAETDGRGVDVVLNSLSDEFIPKSLEVCAEGGRFVELGRIGILTQEEFAERRPDASYHPFVLYEVAAQDPTLVSSMLSDIVRDVVSGDLEVPPLRTFAMADSVAAFRFMAQAKHIGKIVVESGVANESGGDSQIHADGSYLITGGLGALGLRVAQWLVERGARHLVLNGRSAPMESAATHIAALEEQGAEVRVLRGDVSSPEDIEEIFGTIDKDMPPLKGVVHTAVVLDDGVLLRQDIERLRGVLRPKAVGAWNLHRQCLERSPDFFVVFSSTVALLGSPGQSNYAAANAFMDALAHYRHAQGVPGLSINWGPWGEVGQAAELSSRDQVRWQERGVESIPPAAGLELFGGLLQSSKAQVGVLPVDWHRYREQMATGWDLSLEQIAPRRSKSTIAGSDLLAALKQASADERYQVLADHIRHQLAQVLGRGSGDTIKMRQRLFDLGLDSLMAVELRNRLQRSVGQTLRSTVVFDYPTIEALADHLAGGVFSEMMGGSGSTEDSDHFDETGVGGDDAALDALSDEEVARLLAEELGQEEEGPG